MKRSIRHAVTIGIAISTLAVASATAADAFGDNVTPHTGRADGITGNTPAMTTRVVTDGDTYTSTSAIGTAYGLSSELRVGNGSSSNKITYLHFTIPAGDVAHIQAASLVLSRTDHHLPATTISAHQVSGTWSEDTMTASGAPLLGPVLDTESVTPATNSVRLDVTSAVVNQSAMSFAITSPVTDDVAMFSSREAVAATPPMLRLTIDTSDPTRPGPTGPAPTSTPTSSPSSSAPASPTSSPSSPTSGPTGPTNPTCSVSSKLVSSCHVWLGDSPQSYGFVRVPTQAARLAVDETFTGRKFDILHEYKVNSQLFPDAPTIALADQGRRLLMNWKPATDMTWAVVARGGADSRIDAEASYLKSHFNRPFMLTIYHEPEDNVVETPGSGMTMADYVAMYRHTILRLRADGATMFTTVMNYMGYSRWDSMRDALYPGDDVVDWIAWDPYMYYPSGTAGGDFAAMVDTAHGSSPGFYTWATTKHPGKPLMLAEWGLFDEHLSSNPMGPSQFFPTVTRELPRFPALKALVYFTMNPVDVPFGQATQPTITAAGLSAWRTMAQAPIFGS